MKCSNCGAEIGNDRFCQYCGTPVSASMIKDQERLNMSGCPRCHSTNIQFKRENQGEIRSKKSKRIIYNTVGFCKDCGFTWMPQNHGQNSSNNNTVLLFIGLILCFPVPLSIILYKNKTLKPAIKYSLIVLSWLLYFIVFIFPKTLRNDSPSQPINSTPAVSQSTKVNTNKSTVGIYDIPSINIDYMVNTYNSDHDDTLTYKGSFTPSDKDSSHYRVEFRLPAFKDAIGKTYSMNGKTIDFVVIEQWKTEYRLYADGLTYNEAKALVNGLAPLFDTSITSEQLEKLDQDIIKKKDINGSYYGNISVCFSQKNKEYHIMMKAS